MNSIPNIPVLIQQASQLPANDTNLLHVKPVCHQIFRAINHLGADFSNYQSINKGIVATGYVLNIIIATIESVAALAFTCLAVSLHTITRGRFTTLQKITLKICAYNINALLIAHFQVYCLKNRLLERCYGYNAMLNHAAHGSAALVAQLISYRFDRWTDRNPHPANNDNYPPSSLRAFRIFIEIIPRFIRNIVPTHNNNSDLQASFHATLQMIPEILNNPFNRLKPFKFGKINTLSLNLMLNISSIFSFILQRSLEDRIDIIDAKHNEQDKKYFESLQNLIKKSFLELYDNNEKFAKMINNEEDDDSLHEDKELIVPDEIIYPIANYVQLKELQDEISCPQNFEDEGWKRYNTRYGLLLNAQGRLKQLNDDEKSILTEMLLSTADFDFKAVGISEERKKFIHNLFKDIGKLGSQLPGHLLSVKCVDRGLENQELYFEAQDSMNLFTGACQKAIQEIEARQLLVDAPSQL